MFAIYVKSVPPKINKIQQKATEDAEKLNEFIQGIPNAKVKLDGTNLVIEGDVDSSVNEESAPKKVVLDGGFEATEEVYIRSLDPAEETVEL